MKIVLLVLTLPFFAVAAEKLSWQGWSDEVFAKAKAEKKLVILDLEAVWCHWCHVMEEKTYSDPKVIELLKKHYLTVRVDQDSRPDISQRYENWGWPATIIFDGNGQELAKRAGFIEPKAMASMLEAFAKDPTPGPSAFAQEDSAVGPGAFDEATRKSFAHSLDQAFDKKLGGWGSVHKFIQPANIEYSLRQAQKKNEKEGEKVKFTLKQNYQIQDPAWGGVYQYSVRTWKEPHFEKVLALQTANIFAYSLAYRQWRDPKYLSTAESIYNYLTTFLLAPDNGFYTSQDADLVQGQHSDAYFKLGDKARRQKGIPKIDKHQYARENGWVIEALAHLYAASGDEKYLTTATKAAKWVAGNRGLGNGGFRHDEKDLAGPYLQDTLAMGRAFLSLYTVTGNRYWLSQAGEALNFIDKNFRLEKGFGAAKEVSKFVPATPQNEDNVSLTRFANLLYHYTGEEKFRAVADHGLKYLTSPSAQKKTSPAMLLLTEEEMRQDPTHITVVGSKTDPAARSLFLAAIQRPDAYLRVEWWDKQEGNLPRNDVNYPTLAKAAAFLCTGKRCSLPIYEAPQIAIKAEAFN